MMQFKAIPGGQKYEQRYTMNKLKWEKDRLS